MPEQPVVRLRRGVMELVDNHNIERVRDDLLESRLLKRLDHREDVMTLGDPSSAVKLPEGAVAQDRAIGRERLSQDLLAVGNEQQ